MGRAARLVSNGRFPASLAAWSGWGHSGKGAPVPAAARRQCLTCPEGNRALGGVRGCLLLHHCLLALRRVPRHQGGGAGGADQQARRADRQAGGQGKGQRFHAWGCPLGVPAAPAPSCPGWDRGDQEVAMPIPVLWHARATGGSWVAGGGDVGGYCI